MKTNFLSPIILAFLMSISLGAQAQTLVESRSAQLMDGDYTLNGTVYLELYDDNSLDLRFGSDYMTQSNVFDVHVYLSMDNNYVEPIGLAGKLLVANIGTISGLNYSSGAMTFDLPAGTGIDDYDHIVFVCIQFGQLHWGHGAFNTLPSPTLTDLNGTCEVTPSIPTVTAPNGSTVNGVPDVSFPITTPGTTVVTWTFDDGLGNMSTAQQNVTVLGVNTTITQSGTSLTAESGYTYQWVDCNDNYAHISGETNATFEITDAGSYAVIVTDGTCTDTSDCFSFDFTGIDENFQSNIQVYPNPSSGNIQLDFGKTIDQGLLEIKDLNGRNLYSEKILQSNHVQVHPNLPMGSYIIRITSDENQAIIRHIIR